MSFYEKISCRIAIQVCIGYFPDGGERHRTFSIKGIKPDASLEAIANLARALAPVLAYPITKVRKVVKREIFFYVDAAMPIPLESAEPKAQKIIPFPVPERPAAYGFTACSVKLPFLSLSEEPSSRRLRFPSKRAPPHTVGNHMRFYSIGEYGKVIKLHRCDLFYQLGELHKYKTALFH